MRTALLIIAALAALVLGSCGGTDSATSDSAEIPTESGAQAAKRPQPTVSAPPTPPPKEVLVEDLIEGSGPAAEDDDRLTLQYVGKTWGGNVYADTWAYETPPSFVLGAGRLPEGFETGLRGMKEGGRREISVPTSLMEPLDYEEAEIYKGYERQAPLEPADTLFLVVDLLEVN